MRIPAVSMRMPVAMPQLILLTGNAVARWSAGDTHLWFRSSKCQYILTLVSTDWSGRAGRRQPVQWVLASGPWCCCCSGPRAEMQPRPGCHLQGGDLLHPAITSWASGFSSLTQCPSLSWLTGRESSEVVGTTGKSKSLRKVRSEDIKLTRLLQEWLRARSQYRQRRALSKRWRKRSEGAVEGAPKSLS